jgi:hypothetical protein
MRLSSLIIGILIIGSMIVGFYSFTRGMADEESGYDIEVDDQYEEKFAYSENVSREINTRYDEMMNMSANKGSTIGIITLVPDVLVLLKNIIVLPFSLVGGIIGSIVEFLQLPGWMYTFMITMMTIAIVFAFVALVLRYKNTQRL